MEQDGPSTPSKEHIEKHSFVARSKILLARKSTKIGCLIEPDINTTCKERVEDLDSNITMVEPFILPKVLNKSSEVSETNCEPNLKSGNGIIKKTTTPVVAKIYETTSASPSSALFSAKIRTRPKSVQEYNSSQLGLCCSFSERSLTPAGHILASVEPKIDGVMSRPLGISAATTTSPCKTDEITSLHDSLSSSSPITSSKTSSVLARKPSPIPYKNFAPVSPAACNQESPTIRMRRRLLSRRSVDNLVAKSNTDSGTVHSSPESTRSVPTDNTIRSSSTDTACHGVSASMDSLARQSLLAAQVLHLIPTSKARERNYLQGRVAPNSLLGAVELERVLPKREVRVFVGTWNMNGQTPPKELNDFVLPNGVSHVPDILAVGTQESCSERFEWEVCLQETIGPTHVLLHSANLGTLHLAIFIRRDLIWFCSLPEEASMSVRTGTAFRTKGAVAVSFSLFGTTYLFVTAHLTAHQEKVKERVQDIKRIIRALDLPKNLPVRHKNKDVTQNFDCVFWCGDLNFRLGEPRDKVLQWINTTSFPLPSHLPHGYMHTDQLKAVLSDGAAFKGFREAQITFPPTYKYDPGTQQFDTSSKQRAPAYTDRVLFKSRPALTGPLRRNSHVTGIPERPMLECVAYDSVPSMITSDHKPVWALFKNFVRPGIDTIPLAAGLFNRDVYLEGVRRRAATLDLTQGASGVCSIQ